MPVSGKPSIGIPLPNPSMGSPVSASRACKKEGWGHHVDHGPAVDLAVSEALAVVLPHGVLPPEGGGLHEGPDRLSGVGIDRHNVPALTGHADQLAVHIQRCGTRVHAREFGPVPRPGQLEIGEVLRIDLVERRVPLARRVARDVPPIPFVLRSLGLLAVGSTPGDHHGTECRSEPESGGPGDRSTSRSTHASLSTHVNFSTAWDVENFPARGATRMRAVDRHEYGGVGIMGRIDPVTPERQPAGSRRPSPGRGVCWNLGRVHSIRRARPCLTTVDGTRTCSSKRR